MNMFNKLPQTIKIKNKKYRINTDFRFMISFETKMRGIETLPSEEQEKILLQALVNFCPAFFERNKVNEDDITLLSRRMLWFYSCGRKNYHKIGNGSSGHMHQIYSYEYDDEYIYGAFYEQYRIDLSTAKLHWWKFRALFISLKSDTQFEQIKAYRTYKGTDKDKLKLKKYWELPQNKNEQKVEEEIAKKLMSFKRG